MGTLGGVPRTVPNGPRSYRPPSARYRATREGYRASGETLPGFGGRDISYTLQILDRLPGLGGSITGLRGKRYLSPITCFEPPYPPPRPDPEHTTHLPRATRCLLNLNYRLTVISILPEVEFPVKWPILPVVFPYSVWFWWSRCWYFLPVSVHTTDSHRDSLTLRIKVLLRFNFVSYLLGYRAPGEGLPGSGGRIHVTSPEAR